MKYRDKFLAYGQYCANLQHATSRLQELCDNSEHSDFNNEVAVSTVPSPLLYLKSKLY